MTSQRKVEPPLPGRIQASPPARLLGLLRVLAGADRRTYVGKPGTRWLRLSSQRQCRRTEPRQRGRLLSAKVIDDRLRFHVECSVHDHSSSGCRVRLARNVTLPDDFRIYLDKDASILCVEVVWRRGLYVGLRVTGRLIVREDMRPPVRWRSLGQRYYAWK